MEEKFQKEMKKIKRKREGGLISLLCSRNARPQKGLVGRAQLETDSGCPPGEIRATLGGTFSSADACMLGSIRPPHEACDLLVPMEGDHGRSMYSKVNALP